MEKAPLPLKEPERLKQLRDLKILDSPPELCFDELVRLAANICQTPIALISLVDHDRQWFKAKIGLRITETSRQVSFCAHAIQKESLLYIPNTHKDKRFANNPLVTNKPNIQFYAGYPIKSPGGMLMGTLCVIDKRPRRLNKEQKYALKVLAGQVSNELRVRSLLRRQAELLSYLEKRESRLSDLHSFLSNFLGILGHDLRRPIVLVKEVLERYANNDTQNDTLKKDAKLLNVALQDLIEFISSLMQWVLYHYQAEAIEKQKIPLVPLIEQKVDFWRKALEDKQLNIAFETTQDFAVSAQSVIEVVLSNLLNNAIKLAPEGSHIHLTANSSCLSIENEGPEMTEKQMRKLFTWSQSDKGTLKGKAGMGFGLKICRELMRHLGGDLVLKHRENGKQGIRAEMIFFT